MRFWDSSAIIPLLVTESRSRALVREFRADPAMIVWWSTEAECISALARLEREDQLHAAVFREALDRLDDLGLAWDEIQPTSIVRSTAIRLLRTHPLRTGDAFQLAAAITAAEGNPATLPFVTEDVRLAQAAEREGFAVSRS